MADCIDPKFQRMNDLVRALDAERTGYRLKYDAENRRAEKAEAACAEMRRALEETSDSPGRRCWCYGRHSESPEPHLDFCMQAQHALSTDCGKGWVSPEEHREALRDAAEKTRRKITALELDLGEAQQQLEQAQARFCEAHQVAEVGETCPCCAAVAKANEAQRAQAEAAAAVDWIGQADHLPDCDLYCSCGRRQILDGTAAKALLERLNNLELQLSVERDQVEEYRKEIFDDLYPKVKKLEAVRGAAEEVKRTREEALPNSGCCGMCFIPKYEWNELCTALDACEARK